MKKSNLTAGQLFAMAFVALGAVSTLYAADTTKPIASANLVFDESGGIVAVEAEHFFKQTEDKVRAWHVTTAGSQPNLKPDADPAHMGGASGGAYVEALPDSRRNHGEKLIKGENFSPEPGKMAILHYKVHFNTPGRYHVWVRAHSTGSEDNGIHVGIDGEWPESGRRWQTVAKHNWHWDSKQRTEKAHTGVPGKLFLDVKTAGEHVIAVSMREDGFEFDKFVMVNQRDYKPTDLGPSSKVKSGKVPAAFPFVAAPVASSDAAAVPATSPRAGLLMPAVSFPTSGSGYYADKDKWLAVNPEQRKDAKAMAPFPFAGGRYHLTLQTVGENDGRSSYEVFVNDVKLGAFLTPLSKEQFEEGKRFHNTWKNIEIGQGDVIAVRSVIGSEDGQEFSRARWSALAFAPANEATKAAVAKMAAVNVKPVTSEKAGPPLVLPRKSDGKGEVTISGELKQWHKVTLTLDGPYAHERDNKPNPFTDYRMFVMFVHESGSPRYNVPGYFAADGNAAESGAESGTRWRAHLSAYKPGRWTYLVTILRGEGIAFQDYPTSDAKVPGNGVQGSFAISPTDKTGRDLRAKGRLQYVGERYLRFAGTGDYFLKAGADAPETFLGYRDFDGTEARKAKVPLKTWAPHVKDWKPGDPTWKNGKGKGMIGALNYLAGKGCNVFSFMPYNAGGDGDNVWPFTERDDKFHYDCSKLDQWGIVFDHATKVGHYLHFKLQETEMDDNRRRHNADDGIVPTSLDGGRLGPERKLYCRELIARFGHALALNWNLGEENTQSTKEQKDMAQYLHDVDPYDHLIVVHTFPNQQDTVYPPLFGKKSTLSGFSLQNSNIADTHWQVVKWVDASTKAGKPWVVAFDESGNAAHAQVPDLGYEGFNGHDVDGKKVHTQHEVRKQTLWGTLMGGGAGCEYYFGYKLAQNDLICEDWRSRDQSWDYCRIALEFFRDHKIPFPKMRNADALVGTDGKDNSRYCFAKPNEIYLVYLANGGTTQLDITGAKGSFSVNWFNPRVGGALTKGSVKSVRGGAKAAIGNPPTDSKEDWLVVVRK